MNAKSLALELFDHGHLTVKQLNRVINFEEYMLFKVKFKDCTGTCYFQGDYTLDRECADPGNANYLVKKLNQIILPKLSINWFKQFERRKNGWVDIECWEHSPMITLHGSVSHKDNRIIKTIRLKINPFKLNLGILELIVDKV
jgi:hypothetical protein